MEGNKDKVIHIFQCDGTLTPPGMTMHDKFVEFFLDWAETNDYCLLTESTIKTCKLHIPEPIIFKAKYVFGYQGKEMYKYKGLRWMKQVETIEDFKDSSEIIDLLDKEYSRYILFSHECNNRDKELVKRLLSTFKCESYPVDEWKDTAIFMKRIMWDNSPSDYQW